MNTKAAIYVRVSTDEQRDNGYSIDSQIRMLTKYCEENNYTIIDIFNDAGYSGKDLYRPAMQRLIKDIEKGKIDRLVAIKTDRLTRNSYDGHWLLNHCTKYDVKIELTLEPYDISTANGEMMFGMNLIFGQRERKEIGTRTKRGLEEMVLQKIHPGKAPYGYTRNKETGHLEINPIEAVVIKEIFELCAKGLSYRKIASIMREHDRYLREGKWSDSRVFKILDNEIYIGTFYFGKFRRKKEDVIVIKNYCEPIISKELYDKTRKTLEKNKHENYGKHIHLFSSLVKCPCCHKIMSSTLSYKKGKDNTQREYYFLTCKNKECEGKGIYYNCDRLEKTLVRILNELTIYMLNNPENIIAPKNDKDKEFKRIEKSINKLKEQEKKLVDLYLSSNVDVETINNRNLMIKKELETLEDKKSKLNENDVYDVKVELLSEFNDNNLNKYLLNNELPIYRKWEKLDKTTRRYIIQKFIKSIEIQRDDDYFIDITDIKFNKEYFSKNADYFLNDLILSLKENYKGFIYKPPIDMETLLYMMQDNEIISVNKYLNNEDINDNYKDVINKLVSEEGVIVCSLVVDKVFVDELLFIPKNA